MRDEFRQFVDQKCSIGTVYYRANSRRREVDEEGKTAAEEEEQGKKRRKKRRLMTTLSLSLSLSPFFCFSEHERTSEPIFSRVPCSLSFPLLFSLFPRL